MDCLISVFWMVFSPSGFAVFLLSILVYVFKYFIPKMIEKGIKLQFDKSLELYKSELKVHEIVLNSEMQKDLENLKNSLNSKSQEMSDLRKEVLSPKSQRSFLLYQKRVENAFLFAEMNSILKNMESLCSVFLIERQFLGAISMTENLDDFFEASLGRFNDFYVRFKGYEKLIFLCPKVVWSRIFLIIEIIKIANINAARIQRNKSKFHDSEMRASYEQCVQTYRKEFPDDSDFQKKDLKANGVLVYCVLNRLIPWVKEAIWDLIEAQGQAQEDLKQSSELIKQMVDGKYSVEDQNEL